MIDIEQVGSSPSLSDLEAMHNRKTGALISASVLIGARLAGVADGPEYLALSAYAQAIGLAFQVRDDILDQVSSADIMGKNSGMDQLLGKPNFVSLLGLAGANQQLADNLECALASLHVFDGRADTLRQLARHIVDRMH